MNIRKNRNRCLAGGVSARKSTVKLAVSAAIFAGLTPPIAGAQMLEEVVVTAQKREQSLRDVPISVATVAGTKLEEQGFLKLEDLATFVPNLAVKQGIAQERLHIRGVGSGVNAGFEQSVGTFIDGVYFGRAKQSLSQLLDIDRIEVLKGPQSTYFGNNAIAGALNVTTRKPGDEWEGFVQSLLAEDGQYSIDVATGGPINDTLGIRLAGKASGMDGFLEDPFNRRDVNALDSWVARGTLVWTPTDRFDATLKLEANETDQEGNNFQIVDCPPPAELGILGGPSRGCAVMLFNPAAAAAVPSFEDEINGTVFEGGSVDASFPFANSPPAPAIFDRAGFRDFSSENFALTMNYALGEHTLTSITGYTSYENDRFIDFDGTPSAQINVNALEQFDQLSQELRIVSPVGDTFEYIAGIYYETTELDFLESFYFRLPLSFFTAFPDTFVLQPRDHRVESESFAVFGALTWNISDTVRATVGLRYTDVGKDVTHVLTNTDVATGAPVDFFLTLPPPDGFGLADFTVQDEFKDDDVSPSVNVQWDVTPDTMVYASYAQGYKAGGFNAQFQTLALIDTFKFDAETVDAYEIGAKSSLLDGRFTLNTALFRNEYDNLQVSARNGTEFVTGNAASSISQGLELDASLQATENLQLGMALAILDAEYEDFQNAACDPYAKAEFAATAPNPFSLPVSQLVLFCDQDLTGESLQYAPDWETTLSLRYQRPLSGNLQLLSSLDVNVSDDYQIDGANDRRLIQDSPVRVNLRIGVGSQDGKWEVAFVGRNLTDELVSSAGGELRDGNGTIAVSIEQPRSVGVNARYNW